MIPNQYLEKVYAGFLGMNIGIRLGAPVEPLAWTYERIEAIYGDIRDYVKPYRNFAADDDVNGPVYFLRALDDDARDRELQADDIGKAWLNYAREGIGMFWWGGEGVSTEHTAYLNLKKGIPAPESGAVATNGEIMAEQIGGQIFIDTWGLVFPKQPKQAADYAEKAASVSHDRNGIYGARFIAACIAKAFDANSVDEIIEAGLKEIPSESTYASVVQDVMKFHANHPSDFRACMQRLFDKWGYDKYLGICHIIPNAGVCALSLLYGEGSLSRTVEIATMCGWDTDCNAGNVGTIIGVFEGLQGLEAHYREPINDGIVLSGISGYLNILDVPSYAKEIARHGYRLANESLPPELEDFDPSAIHFDFEIPGSTHNFRLSNDYKFRMRNSSERAYSGQRSLEVMFDRLVEGESGRLFYKPFYRREDFDDERYKPNFAPKCYSGQVVSMNVYLDQWDGAPIQVSSYIRTSFEKKIVEIESHEIGNGIWTEIQFTLPDTKGDLIDEVGLILSGDGDRSNRSLGRIFVDDFIIDGAGAYSIDLGKQAVEFLSVTPFAHQHGEWGLNGQVLSVRSEEETASFTGNYYMRDSQISVKVRPVSGQSHMVILHAQGAKRGYYLGFSAENEVGIYRNDFGFEALASRSFSWNANEEYMLAAKIAGDEITLEVDGKPILAVHDNRFLYGMVGVGSMGACEAQYSDMKITFSSTK